MHDGTGQADDLSFDDLIDDFIDRMSEQPDLSPDSLLQRFPDRAAEILRLLAAAGHEGSLFALKSLPPIPAGYSGEIHRPEPVSGRSEDRSRGPTDPSDTSAGGQSSSEHHFAEGEDPAFFPVEAGLSRLGPYELTELIGRGGMGAVYRARQRKPIDRQVAIKIVRPEIGGQEILARFNNERISLARMNHPHIATVLDGGTTDDGRPYLVMELVEGPILTTWCLRQQLGLTHRLQLFLKVCAAIQHAHQKGVIHRDIKPSNILVTSVDGVAVPKVIDFGLAKAQAEFQFAESSHTQLGQILGTLHYMSPEQAGLLESQVDTRSDIFSLGVVLFELLTGTTPLESLLTSDLAIDERLRIVRQQEPVRPSDRVRQLARTATELRNSSSGFHSQHLRGDLDAVCTKAMANDPSHRYETVAAFADDVQNILHNRPVSASPASELYLLKKFAYRHRVAVAATITIGSVLLAAACISTWLAFRAMAAEQDSENRYTETVAAQAAEKSARLLAERGLYVAHMNLVQQAVRDGELLPALDYLDRHLPANDIEHDLRGFEWYYWRSQLTRFIGELDASEELLTLAFSHDGRYLATGGMEGVVRLWDADSRQMLNVLDHGDDMLGDVAFSSDDRLLAVSGRDRHVSLWNVSLGRRLLSLPHEEMVRTVEFAADDSKLITGCTDGTIRWWDADNGNLLHTLNANEADIYHLAVSPDGKWLASAGGDGTIRIWDMESRKQVVVMTGHEHSVRYVAFSPDSERVASASYDGTAAIWSRETGEMLHHLTEHTERVYAVAFSPDGGNLCTCSRDETIRFWDVASGRQLDVIHGHRFTVYGVAYSPDGSRIASCAHDKTVKFWNTQRDQRPEMLTGHSGVVRGVAFSGDGTMIASASDDETIRVWDPIDGSTIVIIKSDHGVVSNVAFVPVSGDGAQELLAATFGDGTLALFEVPTGRLLREAAAHDDYVYSLDVTPDGRSLATGGNDRRVRIWSGDDLSPQQDLEGHRQPVFVVRFSTDGRTLASGGDDDALLLWDIERNSIRQRISLHQRRVYAVDFAPDGRTLAYAGQDRTIFLADVDSGGLVSELSAHSASVHSLRFTQDGRSLVSSGTGMQTKFWDLATAEVKTNLTGHDLPIQMIAFSPNEQILATAGADQIIRLWRQE